MSQMWNLRNTVLFEWNPHCDYVVVNDQPEIELFPRISKGDLNLSFSIIAIPQSSLKDTQG